MESNPLNPPTPQTLDSTTNPASHQDSPNSPTPLTLDSSDPKQPNDEEAKEGGEEEEECGFCLFMKGGGCKESFIAWEKCVEEAEERGEDIAEKCFQVTSVLKKCMDAHADYYEPILAAEKAMAEDVADTLTIEEGSEPVKDSVSKSES